MFHKEGFQIISITLALFTGFTILFKEYILETTTFYVIIGLMLVIVGLILQFFRNPKRVAPLDPTKIVSPVDGKVVVIENVEEPEYFKGKRTQVSIFMSPLNVHVTRMPVAGNIVYSRYHPGKYLVAWHPKASEENERTTVVVRTKRFGDILYRQIAGAVAKRIINYAQYDEQFEQGEDSGFIRFGSRVDLFLPIEVPVSVEINQKVRGGETVIASL